MSQITVPSNVANDAAHLVAAPGNGPSPIHSPHRSPTAYDLPRTSAGASPAVALPPIPSSAPPTVLAAFAASNPAASEHYTWDLAHNHYENFSVVSLLLPRTLRQDFCNVYAFCRTADDLGDEVGDRALATALLGRFKADTRACYAGHASTLVFSALAATIRRHAIPIEPFLDLIDAFEQDQRIGRYETFEDVTDYCRRSADPVGRLVLYMCGYRDAERQRLSDLTCTALQLANFLQDVRRDLLDRDRIYLSTETLRRFGVTEQQLRDGAFDDNYRRMMRFEVERTAAMFAQGRRLLPMLHPAVRQQVKLFSKGGTAILQAIARQDYDTLTRRPVLSKRQKGRLVLSALGACVTRKAAALTGMGW